MLEYFRKAENNGFEEIGFQKEREGDYLLMKIAEVEAEWNALIIGSAKASARNTKNSLFEMGLVMLLMLTWSSLVLGMVIEVVLMLLHMVVDMTMQLCLHGKGRPFKSTGGV